MGIKIKLYGVFRIDRFKEEVRDYPPGIIVREVVEDLRIPDRLLGIVLINGIHAGVDDFLKDGDSLTLLPLLGGG
jgi:molybdopterin converting factor small subunit